MFKTIRIQTRTWTQFILASFAASIFTLAFMTLFALADELVIMPPTQDEIMALLASLGGLKGMGVLGIVAVVVQGLMLFFRTPLADFAGKWKLTIVLGLSLVGGVVGLVATGMAWLPALLHSTTLAAAQVFIHQLVKQVTEKPAV